MPKSKQTPPMPLTGMTTVAQRLTHVTTAIEDAATQLSQVTSSTYLNPDQKAAAVMVIGELKQLASDASDFLKTKPIKDLSKGVPLPQIDIAAYDVAGAIVDLAAIVRAEMPLGTLGRLDAMIQQADQAAFDIAMSVRRIPPTSPPAPPIAPAKKAASATTAKPAKPAKPAKGAAGGKTAKQAVPEAKAKGAKSGKTDKAGKSVKSAKSGKSGK